MKPAHSIINLSAHDIQLLASWPMVIEAIRSGHRLPRASIGDTLVGAGENMMLVRSAYIEGLAAGVKAATVVPNNPDRKIPLPSIHAQIMLFDDDTGKLYALLDGTEITAWKTAADSALGCDLLARKDVKTFLMVGAGAMAEPLIRAHLSVRPNIQKILLWNRSPKRVEALLDKLSDVAQDLEIVSNLDDAVPQADIICCATMSRKPVLKGALVSAGAHVDLVGAYKADMREADDDLHHRGLWFVDSFETTLDHIGELKSPLDDGIISREAIKADLHMLVAGEVGRDDDEQITVYKNGGGAHLDIMVSAALVQAQLAIS
ncbi:MAG: ornithine cyclodeaminase [Rhizobiaceae bacterium]